MTNEQPRPRTHVNRGQDNRVLAIQLKRCGRNVPDYEQKYKGQNEDGRRSGRPTTAGL